MSALTRSPRPSRRSRAFAPLAFCLVLASLFAQLSSLAHTVAVRHVRCAEHGDWVHAGEVQEAHHAEVSAGSDAFGGPSAAPRSTDEGHEHDHCVLASLRRERALDTSASMPAAFVTAPVRVIVADSVGTLAARAVYAFAPKTSPPA